MPFRFNCEKCDVRIKVPDGSEGKKVKCPGCGHAQRVPGEPVAQAVVQVPVMKASAPVAEVKSTVKRPVAATSATPPRAMEKSRGAEQAKARGADQAKATKVIGPGSTVARREETKPLPAEGQDKKAEREEQSIIERPISLSASAPQDHATSSASESEAVVPSDVADAADVADAQAKPPRASAIDDAAASDQSSEDLKALRAFLAAGDATPAAVDAPQGSARGTHQATRPVTDGESEDGNLHDGGAMEMHSTEAPGHPSDMNVIAHDAEKATQVSHETTHSDAVLPVEPASSVPVDVQPLENSVMPAISVSAAAAAAAAAADESAGAEVPSIELESNTAEPTGGADETSPLALSISESEVGEAPAGEVRDLFDDFVRKEEIVRQSEELAKTTQETAESMRAQRTTAKAGATRKSLVQKPEEPQKIDDPQKVRKDVRTVPDRADEGGTRHTDVDRGVVTSEGERAEAESVVDEPPLPPTPVVVAKSIPRVMRGGEARPARSQPASGGTSAIGGAVPAVKAGASDEAAALASATAGVSERRVPEAIPLSPPVVMAEEAAQEVVEAEPGEPEPMAQPVASMVPVARARRASGPPPSLAVLLFLSWALRLLACLSIVSVVKLALVWMDAGATWMDVLIVLPLGVGFAAGMWAMAEVARVIRATARSNHR